MYPNVLGAPGFIALGPDMGQSIPSVPIEQPKQLFRYGEQAIWSSQFLGVQAVANNTLRLFSTPVGQVGQGFAGALSIAETNLKEGGRIPSGVAYDVFGISCAYGLATGATDASNPGTLNASIDDTTANGVTNLMNFLNNTVLTWDFTQTQVDVAPAMLIGGGGGLFGAVSQDNGTAATIGHVGQLQSGNGQIWLYRKHPVALPGNTTFAMLLRFGSRAASQVTSYARVRVSLLGYYKNIIEIG